MNSWPYVCDWNDDGKKDLLVGQSGIGEPCNVYVYLNQGTNEAPVFGDSTPVTANGQTFRNYRCIPVLRDMDGDSIRDLTLGEWYSSIRFYHNSGTNAEPVFTTFVNLVEPDPDSFRNGNPPRLAHADWDGDDDLDMITCDYYGWVTLRENITVSGVAGEPKRRRAVGDVPTVLSRAQLLAVSRNSDLGLFDASGREIPDPGRVSPGVFFLRSVTTCRRVILSP